MCACKEDTIQQEVKQIYTRNWYVIMIYFIYYLNTLFVFVCNMGMERYTARISTSKVQSTKQHSRYWCWSLRRFFCASINVCQRISHVSPEAWQAVIEINLRRIIFKVFVLQRNFWRICMRFVEDNGHDQPISDSFFAKPRPVMWNRKLRPWGLWTCKCMTWKLVQYWTLHSLHVTT